MHRPDDHDGVALGVDLTQQPTDERVGALERLGEEMVTLHRRGEDAVGVLAHQIGRLDEHDRARLPDVAERAQHGFVVVSQAERRVRVLEEQLGPERAGRHLSVRSHQPRDGLPPVVPPEWELLGVVPVAVGDHRSGPVAAGELVAKGADLGVEQLLPVLVDDAGDPEVHEAAVGITPRPALEGLTGGDVAERLVDTEALAVGVRLRPDRPRTGPEGHVAVGGRRLAVDRPRREAADGGRVEQPDQVRKLVLAGLDVLPRHGGERDDEHPPRLRLGRTRPGTVGHADQGERHRQHREEAEGDRAPHASTSALSGSRSGTSGSSTRRRSTRPPVARTPRRYNAPPTMTITVHRRALATRPAGSTTETTPHAATPITAERPMARGSAAGTIACPVRRDRPTLRISVPAVYAMEWPIPSAATRAAPSVR